MINDWSMIADGHPLCFRGRPIRLTPLENSLCWSLLKAFPAHVKKETLLLRLDSDSHSNVIQSMVSKIRRKCDDSGLPDPIETIWAVGYRWCPVGDCEPLEEPKPLEEILGPLYDVPGVTKDEI